MKFLLNDPISYDEIWGAIRAYIDETEGHKMPSYILIHPQTRYKLMITERDDEQGMRRKIIFYTLPSIDEGLRSTEKCFDLWIIKSEDVEPGFMILCG